MRRPSFTPYQAANEVVWRYAIAFAQTELAGVTGFMEMLTPRLGGLARAVCDVLRQRDEER